MQTQTLEAEEDSDEERPVSRRDRLLAELDKYYKDEEKKAELAVQQKALEEEERRKAAEPPRLKLESKRRIAKELSLNSEFGDFIASEVTGTMPQADLEFSMSDGSVSEDLLPPPGVPLHNYGRRNGVTKELTRVEVCEEVKQVKVVVVGGGIAGLVTARELAILGYKVTILEASHRLGGRIMSKTVNIPASYDDDKSVNIGLSRHLGDGIGGAKGDLGPAPVPVPEPVRASYPKTLQTPPGTPGGSRGGVWDFGADDATDNEKNDIAPMIMRPQSPLPTAHLSKRFKENAAVTPPQGYNPRTVRGNKPGTITLTDDDNRGHSLDLLSLKPRTTLVVTSNRNADNSSSSNIGAANSISIGERDTINATSTISLLGQNRGRLVSHSSASNHELKSHSGNGDGYDHGEDQGDTDSQAHTVGTAAGTAVLELGAEWFHRTQHLHIGICNNPNPNPLPEP